MKRLKLILLTTLAILSHNSAANVNEDTPAGFVPVRFDNYKPGNDGVFMFCDAPSPNKESCRDIMIRGSGSIKTEYQAGKWRTADEYVKYKINNKVKFIDFDITSQGVYLIYKKVD